MVKRTLQGTPRASMTPAVIAEAEELERQLRSIAEQIGAFAESLAVVAHEGDGGHGEAD